VRALDQRQSAQQSALTERRVDHACTHASNCFLFVITEAMSAAAGVSLQRQLAAVLFQFMSCYLFDLAIAGSLYFPPNIPVCSRCNLDSSFPRTPPHPPTLRCFNMHAGCTLIT
jgi:hypothetical protein